MSYKIKVYIIAGEVSGDSIGSKIMTELQQVFYNKIEFKGIGGEQMTTAGLISLFPMQEISIIGITEIILNLRKLLKLIQATTRDIIEYQPDVIITIDSPSFGFKVASSIKSKTSAKLVHIVAPSVWAYNSSRAKKFAKIYDHLFAILPFEPPFFEKHGLHTTYIGCPAFEQNFQEYDHNFLHKHQISKDNLILCLTPGSRMSEIKKHLPIFLKAAEIISQQHPNLVNIIIASDKINQDFITSNLSTSVRTIVTQDKMSAYNVAHFAIAKSGTNILELAACKVPIVVGYKVSFFTWIYLKYCLKIKYACLINIIMDREVIPEYIQNKCTPENLAKAALKLVGPDKEKQINQVTYPLVELGLHSLTKPSHKICTVLLDSIFPKNI